MLLRITYLPSAVAGVAAAGGVGGICGGCDVGRADGGGGVRAAEGLGSMLILANSASIFKKLILSLIDWKNKFDLNKCRYINFHYSPASNASSSATYKNW